jgi:hypothetical protein
MHCRLTITWIEIGCWPCWIIDRLFRRHPLGLLLVISQIDRAGFCMGSAGRHLSASQEAPGRA